MATQGKLDVLILGSGGREHALLKACLRSPRVAQVRVAAGKDAVVACLGLAFKANVDDLRESPAVEIASHLAAAGLKVLAVEPHVTALPKALQGRAELVSLADALARASVIVLLVDHRAFAGLTLEQLKGKKLIDTRGMVRA